jgi:hypothetical protein
LKSRFPAGYHPQCNAAIAKVLIAADTWSQHKRSPSSGAIAPIQLPQQSLKLQRLPHPRHAFNLRIETRIAQWLALVKSQAYVVYCRPIQMRTEQRAIRHLPVLVGAAQRQIQRMRRQPL